MTKLKEFVTLYMEFIVYIISTIALTALLVLTCYLAISGIIYFIKGKIKQRKKSKFDKRKDRPGSFSYDDRYEGLTKNYQYEGPIGEGPMDEIF